jgi:Tol biopolymer transport system component
MNPDGSGVNRLTNETLDYMPTWSSDGTRIGFIGPSDGLFYINSDGSAETPVTGTVSPGLAMWRPSWSKSGNDQILFNTQPAPSQPEQIYTVNANGSSLQQLTFGGTLYNNQEGNFSADGLKIVYSCHEICVMNADGSGVQQLTTLTGNEPRWSPDGSRIVFSTCVVGSPCGIFVINADGSNLTQVDPGTYGGGEINPTWLNNSQIVFASNRDYGGSGTWEIYSMSADGSNQTRLTRGAFTSKPYPDCSWCPRFDK